MTIFEIGLILAIFCLDASRETRADDADDFAQSWKVACDANRHLAQATINCERGKARIAVLSIQAYTDGDIQRWQSSPLADRVEQLEVARDVRGGSRRLETLRDFPRLHALIVQGLVTQSDVDGYSGLRQLRELDLSGARLDRGRGSDVPRFGVMPTLRRLNLFGLEMSATTTTNLLPLSGLQELSIWGNELTDEGIGELARLADLRALAIDSVTDSTIKTLARFPRLERLEAGIKARGRDTVDPSPLRTLKSLNIHFIDNRKTTVRLPDSLRTLQLPGKDGRLLDVRPENHIVAVEIDLGGGYPFHDAAEERRPADMSWLRHLPELRNLTITSVSRWQEVDAVNALTSLRSLKILAGEHAPWPNGKGVLERLPALTQLESLDAFIATRADFDAIKKIPTLQSIGLVCVRVDEEYSLESLLSLKHLKHLRLDLSIPSGTPPGAVEKWLGRLGELRDLEELELGGDEAFSNNDLAGLARVVSLRKLALSGATGFDAAGISSLATQLPNLQEVKVAFGRRQRETDPFKKSK